MVDDEDFAGVLAAAQDGDEGAFAILFRSVQPALLRYLRTLARNLHDGTADDVAAETWVQVVRGLERLRSEPACEGRMTSARDDAERFLHERLVAELRPVEVQIVDREVERARGEPRHERVRGVARTELSRYSEE